MFSPASSIWKLCTMLTILVLAAMVLIWVLTSRVLTRGFEAAGRAVVLDDLGEYEALYQRLGVDGVKDLFTAGHHERDQFLRIVDAAGNVNMQVLLPGAQAMQWPGPLEHPPLTVVGATAWDQVAAPEGAALTIGRRKLADGGEIWFGRSNASDLEALSRVHRSISLTMIIMAVLAVAPVIWFSSRVLRPVHHMIAEARTLARSDATLKRLENTAGIHELQEFANAFNQSLDRVHSLTGELEAANDQLAHEIRTPLARIRGDVENLLSHAKGAAPCDSAVHALAEIDRASRLVQTIFTIRSGDARTLKLQMERVSLADLVRETCDLYAAAAETKGLTLDSVIPAEDVCIEADAQRLQQALCNLLDNALAFTPSGGKVQVDLEHCDQEVTLRVRDTGPGLSESDPGRIWQRFKRGSAASASAPGIGLGLSLVKAVVNAHGATAGAQNRPGGGAEFWIRLPKRMFSSHFM